MEFNYVARGSVSDAAFFDALLSCETAEIVCPCALRYQVTQESLKTMLNKTWSGVPTKDRFVVPGANNAYGMHTKEGLIEDRYGIVAAQLRAERICTVPDWVANSGTAQVPTLSSLSSLHSHLCTLISALSSLHSRLCTLVPALSSLHSRLCTLVSALSSLHSHLCTLVSALSSLHSHLCTLIISLLTLISAL